MGLALLALGSLRAGEWEDGVKKAAKLHQKGALPQAEAVLLKTLYTAEAFGEADPRLAYTLDYLGTLNMQMNQPDKASAMFERAVRAFKVSRGENSPEAMESAGRLAESYEAQERWAKAEPIYRALVAAKRGDALLQSADLNSLAVALDAQGKPKEALELYGAALALREKSLGPQAAELPEILNNIARVYYLSGDYSKAEPLYARAIAIDEAQLKPGAPELADDYRRLAALYKKTGREALAAQLEAKAQAPQPKNKKKKK
jgi:tetratricopeptide (TPR) repeat protein